MPRVPEERIGQYARRPDTRTHLVQSVIADRVVTKCGRQMRDYEHARLMFQTDPADDGSLCQACLNARLREAAVPGPAPVAVEGGA